MAMALGVFNDNIMPGITTIDEVADDVYNEHLNIATEHWHCPDMDVAFINSKGFGGNNATATVLSSKVSLAMMEKRYGSAALKGYYQKLNNVEQAQQVYRDNANRGQFDLIYKFGEGMVDEAEIKLTPETLSFAEFKHSINLPSKNPFDDMV
jgi:acetoacetyl-[acyl-carrier protein] synthase